jgi:hypothetical protein
MGVLLEGFNYTLYIYIIPEFVKCPQETGRAWDMTQAL